LILQKEVLGNSWILTDEKGVDLPNVSNIVVLWYPSCNASCIVEIEARGFLEYLIGKIAIVCSVKGNLNRFVYFYINACVPFNFWNRVL
jgi:hypothetical protein